MTANVNQMNANQEHPAEMALSFLSARVMHTDTISQTKIYSNTFGFFSGSCFICWILPQFCEIQAEIGDKIQVAQSMLKMPGMKQAGACGFIHG